jgi:hypothetical protein
VGRENSTAPFMQFQLFAMASGDGVRCPEPHCCSRLYISARPYLKPKVLEFPKEKSPMKLRVICVIVGFLSLVLSLAAQTPGSSPASPASTITGSGTADYVPVFTGTTTIGNSKIFQTVGGDVGIGTTTPAAELDVKGTGDVRDTHSVSQVHSSCTMKRRSSK